jgi:acyl-CoA thioesterase
MHIELKRINNTAWRAPTDASYGTFLGAFGGWTCAAGVLAATEMVEDTCGFERDPLALTINWYESAANERSALPAATLSLVFANRRLSDHIDVIEMPDAPQPETVKPASFANEQVSWPAQYDQRLVLGTPFKPNVQMRSLTWTRNADLEAMTFARLAAMADASVPRIFFHYANASPISTVTMTLQFHCNAAELESVGNDFVLIEATAQAARHGYFDQHIRLFARSGLLLATSTQLVWFSVATP